MSKPDAWMPLYIADYLADTTRLTTEQHGAYLLLIMDYWRNGPPPDDDSVLATITKLSPEQFSKHRPVLARLFEIVNGEWRHKRIEAELEEARKNAQKHKARAKLAAEARWSKGRNDASSNASSNATRNAYDMLEQCPSPSPEKISPDRGSVTPHSSGSARARDDGGGGVSTEAGRMAKVLRERGVNITPSNPDLVGWIARGATVQLVLDAVTEARASKPEPEQIAAKYLAPIVTRMLAGPSTTGPPSIQAGDSNHGNRRGSGYATSRGTRKSSAADEARDAERRLEERLRRERGEDVARRGIQGDGQVVDAHDRDFRPPVEVAVR